MAEKKETAAGAKKPGRPKKETAAREATFAPEENDFFAFDADVGTTAEQTAPVEAVAEDEPQTEQTKTSYTQDEVEELIRKATEEAVRKAMASVPQQQAAPNIIQYVGDTEKVHFLWQAEVADDNTVFFGDGGMYGQIVGKTGHFYVPKSELSRVLTDVNRVYLKRRWLIVVSGLTEEERAALGVDYREGELLDNRAFAKMVELGDELLSIYPKLCEGHRKMVAQRYMEAYSRGSAYVTRERVVKLNAMSKEVNGGNGDFDALIRMMNDADAQ